MTTTNLTILLLSCYLDMEEGELGLLLASTLVGCKVPTTLADEGKDKRENPHNFPEAKLGRNHKVIRKFHSLLEQIHPVIIDCIAPSLRNVIAKDQAISVLIIFLLLYTSKVTDWLQDTHGYGLGHLSMHLELAIFPFTVRPNISELDFLRPGTKVSQVLLGDHMVKVIKF